MKNTYLTSYNKLVDGTIQKFAGPNVKARTSDEAKHKLMRGKKTQRIPLQIEGRLIERIDI